MDPNRKMKSKDSEICTCYQFPSQAYPRFSYVQDSLKSFYPRFLRTLAKLPQCLKWMDLANSIGKSVEVVIKKQPEIILFGQKHSQIQKDKIVVASSVLDQDCKTDIIPRIELLPRISNTTQVLVYTCAADQKLHQELVQLEKELSTSGLDNMLVLLDVGKRSEQEAQVLVEDVIKSLPDATRDQWRNKMIQNMPQNTVCTEISNILELQVVREFQRIEECIKEILSVQRQRQDGGVIFGEKYLLSALLKFLQDEHIVMDLMDVSNKMDQSNKERSTDQFTSIEEQIIQFIERAVTTQFSAIFKIANWVVHNVLMEDMKFQENCMKNISAATRRGIRSDLSQMYMNYQSSDIRESHPNQMETDEPLEGKQIGAKCQIFVKKLNNRRCKDLLEDRANDLLKDINIVLAESEGLIRGVHASLTTLNHLRVELNGVLIHTVINHKKEHSFLKTQEQKQAKKMTVEPFDVWLDKLMRLKDVQGCCDYYGKLMVVISNQGSIDKEQEVMQKISKCLANCPYDYDVKIGTQPQVFANPNQGENAVQDLNFSAGQKICWKNDDGDCRHGTLGIFLQNNKDKKTVYLVTNGHVTPHIGTVQIIGQDGLSEEIGNKAWSHNSELVDIAAVKVKPELVTKCIFDVENYKKEECSYIVLDTNSLQSEELVGQTVFKKGAETGPKSGVISSKTSLYRNNQMIRRYNMLVGPPPGSDPDEVFAIEGDSGSVISLCRPMENPACIVAMVSGGLLLTPPLSQMAYSKAEMQLPNTEKLCLTFFLLDGINALNNEYKLDLNVELTHELLL